jgi:macrodomain Ter protein organizer (MatP/YcbG family)
MNKGHELPKSRLLAEKDTEAAIGVPTGYGSMTTAIQAKMYPTMKARMAQSLLERRVQSAGFNGRHEEVAKHACDLADTMYEEYVKRGWLLEIPLDDVLNGAT